MPIQLRAAALGRAESGDPGARHLWHLAALEDHEEVDAHRSPIHLPELRHAGTDDLPRDVETHRVAELQAQLFRESILHADAIARGLARLGRRIRHPFTRHSLVVLRHVGRMTQVELALHQALRAPGLELHFLDRLVIDGGQSATEHGVPVQRLNTRLLQDLAEALALIRQQVDHEAIRAFVGRRHAPAVQQIRAHQGQQSEGQQAQPQGRHLGRRQPGARRQLAHRQLDPAAAPHHARQKPHGQERQPQQQGARQGKPTEGERAQGGIARHGHEQHGRTDQTSQRRPPRATGGGLHIAAQHAQRWHAGQAQHRRQTKAHQQAKAQPKAQAIGHGASGRQLHGHQVTQQSQQGPVQGPAQEQTKQRSAKADQQELHGVHTANPPAALTEHPQQRGFIHMPRGKVTRCQRHGHARQQGRQQSHQAEEALAPL